MTADELIRMWLTDHAENRYAQAAACEASYRSGKYAQMADRMAAVHRAAGDVYAKAVRELEMHPLSPPATPVAELKGGEG